MPLTVADLSGRITSQDSSDTTVTSLAEVEKELIEHHLRQAGGNKTQAAKILGISREGLRKKMKRLGIA